MKDKNDATLIESCINGDIAAWAVLVNKYSVLISISIEKHLRKYGISLPREEVDDIKQIALSSIWSGKKLAAIRNRNNIAYWLSIVSCNTAIEHVRRSGILAELKTVSLYQKISDEGTLSDCMISNAASPKDDAARSEFEERLESALNSLPFKERMVAKLDIFYNKKYHEIARILGLPRGTVASYLKRAREKLKVKLNDFR